MTQISYWVKRCLLGLAICGLVACSDDSVPGVNDAGSDAGGDLRVDTGPGADAQGDGARPDIGVTDGSGETSAPDLSPAEASTPDTIAPDSACADSDGDTICDAKDVCPGLDDRVDIDGNAVADCSENLLTNGQFRTDVSGWLAESSSGLVFAAIDAQGASASGSAELTHAAVTTVPTVVGSSQCVPVQNGKDYVIYAQVNVLDPNSKGYAGGFNISWYNSANCKGSAVGGADNSPLFPTTSGWATRQLQITSRGASAKIRINVNKPAASGVATVRYDNVLFRAK
jgi:hypothetical protein